MSQPQPTAPEIFDICLMVDGRTLSKERDTVRPYATHVFERVQSHAQKPVTESTLLDVGIYVGHSSLPFKKAGAKITGLDGSTEILRICRAFNGYSEDQVVCHDLEIGTLPFQYNEFDLVISLETLKYVNNAIQIVGKMVRTAKQGGLIGLTIDLDDQDSSQTVESFPPVCKRPYMFGPAEEVLTPIYSHSRKAFEEAVQTAGGKIILEEQIETRADPMNFYLIRKL